MTVTPENECWPIDESCSAELAERMTDEQVARAFEMTASVMRMLTGYSVGGCPVTVRPCTGYCVDTATALLGGSLPWIPLLWNGTWRNACGCMGGCSCGHGAGALWLTPPVGAVTEVKIDGVVLDPATYTLNGNMLLRAAGQTWPVVQDLTKPDTQVGTFSVTYLNARPVDKAGEWAAGILAREFMKACVGGQCSLPPGVTTIVRQGVTMDLSIGAFPDQQTGIMEVDAYLKTVNPFGLRVGPKVWTP